MSKSNSDVDENKSNSSDLRSTKTGSQLLIWIFYKG